MAFTSVFLESLLAPINKTIGIPFGDFVKIGRFRYIPYRSLAVPIGNPTFFYLFSNSALISASADVAARIFQPLYAAA